MAGWNVGPTIEPFQHPDKIKLPTLYELTKSLCDSWRKPNGLIDPFGGVKARLLRLGKEAPLRVNPEQTEVFWPEVEGLTKALVLDKEVVVNSGQTLERNLGKEDYL